MQPHYPSREDIMGHEVKHRKEVLHVVRAWKPLWKKARQSDEQTKFQALATLINQLADLYQKPIIVAYEPETPSCYYQPAIQRLVINKTLSILSTLHEFAHHLYGSSETKACRWSVWLFKKTFPKAFNRLEWQGHMLIRKPQSHDRTNELDTTTQGLRVGVEAPTERNMEDNHVEPQDITT
jgi:hypothetical protein